MDEKQRILIVDDEPQITRVLRRSLTSHGYEVRVAGEGLAAIQTFGDWPPDLVVTDLSMPGTDGLQLCRNLRAISKTPIIVLSVRGEEKTKVEALDAGADDYVTKPFGMDELLARLRASLRRAVPRAEPATVTTPDFTIDLAAKRVSSAPGDDFRLTPTEWRFVEILVRHRGQLVSQRQLLREVWGPQFETETPYLRVHLTAIRRKLEPDTSKPRYFITEPGMGYRFEG